MWSKEAWRKRAASDALPQVATNTFLPKSLTFSTAGVPADTRTAYLKAISASLQACMPLKFTGALGGALAGRPIAIRYVDNRDLGKPSGKP